VTREVAKSIEVVVQDHDPHFTGAPMSSQLIVLRGILRAAADEDDWEQWVTSKTSARVEARRNSIMAEGLNTLIMADRLRATFRAEGREDFLNAWEQA
jgi:hypothetical protein